MAPRPPFFHPTPPNSEAEIRLPLHLSLVPRGVSSAKTDRVKEQDRAVYARGFMVGVERALVGDEEPASEEIVLPQSLASGAKFASLRARQDARTLNIYAAGERDGWRSQTNAVNIASRAEG